MHPLLVLAPFLLGAIGGSAEAPPDTSVYRYPEVIITAARLSLPLREAPFAATVVGPEVLNTAPRDVAIDELLKLTPGVKVDNQANGDRIHLSIRGQGILTERGIRGIKFLLDGIPINDPTGFAPDLFEIDPSFVDRVEILRGPAASLHGASASGGVVNVVSRDAAPVPLSASGSGTGGSNGFWKAYGDFGGQVPDVNYRASYSRTMGDGYRDHTRFWGNTLYGKARYTPSDVVRLTGILEKTHFFHQNPEGINLQQYRENPRQANPDAVPYNEYLETDRTGGGLTGSVGQGAHQLQFAGYTKRTIFTEANNRTFNHRAIATPGVSAQYGYTWNNAERSLRNRIGIGADAQWQRIREHRTDNLHGAEGDTLLSKQEIRQRGLGVYLVDEIRLRDRLTLNLSGRYDAIHNELDDELRKTYDRSGDADFSRATGRVGLTHQVAREISLYANWGQGFLPPATEELAQNPDDFGGFNTHLKEATSQGFDLGSRGAPRDNLYYDVDVFYLTTKNDFDRYRLADNPQRVQETFYRNIGSSRRWGVELGGRWDPLSRLVLQTAYTFSRFQYTSSTPIAILMDDPALHKFIEDGNWLPNSPMHQLTLDAEARLLSGLRAGLTTETLSRAHIDGANVWTEAVPGYTLVHARLSYAFRALDTEWEVTGSVRNIADKTYVAFSEPDPGGNAYQPGPGREFFGGVRIRI